MILYNRLIDMLDHSAHQLNPGRDNSTAADRIDAVDRCSVLWGAMMVAATVNGSSHEMWIPKFGCNIQPNRYTKKRFDMWLWVNI